MAYKTTISEDLLTRLKAGFGEAEFGDRYFYGVRKNVGKDLLPCVCVGIVAFTAGVGPAQTDMVHAITEIRIMFDKRQEFDQTPNAVPLQKTLENLTFGRDNTTAEYASNSVYGILRKFFTISTITVNGESRARFLNQTVTSAINTNPDDPASTVAESVTTIETDERVVVSGRS